MGEKVEKNMDSTNLLVTFLGWLIGDPFNLSRAVGDLQILDEKHFTT